ncbi:hypothetical protein RFI_24903 [Reticulomyxa filosa]|uniref:Uncharacterized protein n=1 Tax=Reticulomyxa filosa TaxID=46433 RepID=X6MGE1_RETFI|nr:hypothetical protein RFI_24903 [Reticulomyxa filosa]|eukprot:ETO12472.1 hypothetical protein RFI_24903 [Reticulomyxa filosa]
MLLNMYKKEILLSDRKFVIDLIKNNLCTYENQFKDCQNVLNNLVVDSSPEIYWIKLKYKIPVNEKADIINKRDSMKVYKEFENTTNIIKIKGLNQNIAILFNRI